jgi:glycosyltransferase involved in cell wall biosynthesis
VSLAGRALRALVYADVDLNAIDGSAIWLQSMAAVLSGAGCAVTVQLRAKVRTTLLIDPIRALPSVRVVEPSPAALRRHRAGTLLTAPAAVASLRALDTEERFDLVVIRGMRIADELARDGTFRGRLWTYLTDMPQSASAYDDDAHASLRRIVAASCYMLCQTEDLRSFLESLVPEAAGKTFLMPPVVPAVGHVPERQPLRGRAIRLVYSGKFAPRWKTLEMTTLPARLAERSVPVELHMIGDKIHFDPDDPTYHDRMQAAMEGSPGVIWHGARSREDAMALASTGDLGLSWRDRSMDASLELSTKVLEFGALGLPVVLNRTPMHERLLGRDYPLFVADEADVIEVIVQASLDPTLLEAAARRCAAAAAGHSAAKGAEAFRAWLGRAFPPPLQRPPGARPLRIGVASHDLKFFARIIEHLRGLPNAEVRVDLWPSPGRQNLAESRRLRDWADVVICEWCSGNAVWYSQNRRDDQRLIVRLHRFELYKPWPSEVDIDRVERVICVSPSYGSLTRAFTGWLSSKITVVPNYVDSAALDRPKLEGARFHLGFIGMAPSRKRFDRALDVLEVLRRQDRRFTLFVKSKLAWEYPWIWADPAERAHLDLVMRRIQTSDLLRDAVVFDDFGPDVGSWLRRIGFVLSTSEDESFHLAPAEGMASGAVPMLLDWPGADTIYDRHWIRPTPAALAEAIGSIVSQDRWDEERALARDQSATFALDSICDAWDALVAGLAPLRTSASDPEDEAGDGVGPRADAVLPFGRS